MHHEKIGKSQRDIFSILSNITSSTVYKLSSKGVNLVSNDERFKNVNRPLFPVMLPQKQEKGKLSD